ncbi:hypothetical protein F5X68DRAFT_246943 [Plectosphaerella plurivora]|uniref:Enoyl reductase (ER) domain-containing protein n=1 Tax=Plectosphaerella plurivora TaxID=936078 RepID=A0A9P9A6Y0_9PEZI|nr:hypothetical protein F5X68DRAFT_246943 [Plectosphaerella plurivora]
MSAPTTTKAWTIEGNAGFDSLTLNPEYAVPALSDNEVLVRIYAGSLNYRDCMIPMGIYPFGNLPGVVPGSDGAGEVVAVGSKVTRFAVGAKVVTNFMQAHIGGPLSPQALGSALGGSIHGTFRQHGVFNENGLVEMPKNLSYLEAGTLSCSALTAWSALYGPQAVRAGDWVLTQGTGGVSISGLQFAKAAGARVVATTSSAAKAEILKKLGADHVINYKETPNWGEEAKKLTGGVGFNQILEVGGANTITESLKAVAIGGVITMIGWIAGQGDASSVFGGLMSALATVRGIVVGSREQFEAMNRAIEANNIKPVLDDKVFKLDELKEAYQYLWDAKHFSKVAINIE